MADIGELVKLGDGRWARYQQIEVSGTGLSILVAVELDDRTQRLLDAAEFGSALEKMNGARKPEEISRPVASVAPQREATAPELSHQLHRAVGGELADVDRQPGPVSPGEDERHRPGAGVLHQDAARLRPVLAHQGEEPSGPSLLVHRGSVEDDAEGEPACQRELLDHGFLLVRPATVEADLSQRHHSPAAEQRGEPGQDVVQPPPGNGARVDAERHVPADPGPLQPRQLDLQEIPEVVPEAAGGGLWEVMAERHRALDTERPERF